MENSENEYNKTLCGTWIHSKNIGCLFQAILRCLFHTQTHSSPSYILTIFFWELIFNIVLCRWYVQLSVYALSGLLCVYFRISHIIWDIEQPSRATTKRTLCFILYQQQPQ